MKVVLDNHSGRIRLYKRYIENDTALLSYLLAETPWVERDIKMFGRIYKQPRLLYYMGDPEASYIYSGDLYNPGDWDLEVFNIKERLEESFSYSFNSCLLNYYRDGQDSMGWHRDNEPELKKDPVIASLSLGETREMCFRKYGETKIEFKIELESGDLLLMEKNLQHHWEHSLPKRAHKKERVNLTFRKIFA